MFLGLDGVEVGLLIVFLMLFGAILSGFPVAFAIGGSAVISFGIIAGLDQAGLLIHQAILLQLSDQRHHTHCWCSNHWDR